MAVRRDLKLDLDRIVETIIYLVTESRRLSKDEASRYGVTPTQLSVLKLLQEIGDLSLGTLSREIRAHNSTVTGIIDRMEAASLVVRARSDEDRRVWIIRLLPEGRRVAERAKVSPWDTLRGALDALPDSEKERLTAILKKVALNVTRAVERTTTRAVERTVERTAERAAPKTASRESRRSRRSEAPHGARR